MYASAHDRSTPFIRQQRGKKGGIKHTLKTDAAYRDIDLHPILAKMLSDFIGDRKEGFVFETATGKPALSRELLSGRLEDNLQADRKNPRSLQRIPPFRESVLLESDARQLLIDYCIGHENPDMSARYGKQLLENAKYRKERTAKVELGFELPQTSKPDFRALEPQSDISCATCAPTTTDEAQNANV